MRVVIAGASGFIGKALVARLRDAPHEVRTLVRRNPTKGDEYRWDPPGGHIESAAFSGVDAIINLGGAPLFPARWSAARKQILHDSRIEPTEVLAEAVKDHGIPLMINASAVGYYGNSGDKTVDESSPAGTGFLAHLCQAWESATDVAKNSGSRVVNLRSGLVLAGSGGLLDTLTPLFTLGLGGKLGDGTQYMPWISLADEIAAIEFILTHKEISGPVNLTSPHPVTNAEFTAELGKSVRRPAPWRVPSPVLKLAIGQAAEEMALYGQKAEPKVLLDNGFSFTHPHISSALAETR